jgi:hypothetical protein
MSKLNSTEAKYKARIDKIHKIIKNKIQKYDILY